MNKLKEIVESKDLKALFQYCTDNHKRLSALLSELSMVMNHEPAKLIDYGVLLMLSMDCEDFCQDLASLLFQFLIKKGDTNAMYYYAKMSYIAINLGRKSSVDVEALYRQACKKDHVLSMVELGKILSENVPVSDPGFKEAQMLAKRAAALNNPEGMLLCVKLLERIGTQESLIMARQWLGKQAQVSVAKRLLAGVSKLAQMCDLGIGGAVDKVSARLYYSQLVSSPQYHADICRYVMMLVNGEGGDIDFEQAITILRSIDRSALTVNVQNLVNGLSFSEEQIKEHISLSEIALPDCNFSMELGLVSAQELLDYVRLSSFLACVQLQQGNQRLAGYLYRSIYNVMHSAKELDYHSDHYKAFYYYGVILHRYNKNDAAKECFRLGAPRCFYSIVAYVYICWHSSFTTERERAVKIMDTIDTHTLRTLAVDKGVLPSPTLKGFLNQQLYIRQRLRGIQQSTHMWDMFMFCLLCAENKWVGTRVYMGEPSQGVPLTSLEMARRAIAKIEVDDVVQDAQHLYVLCYQIFQGAGIGKIQDLRYFLAQNIHKLSQPRHDSTIFFDNKPFGAAAVNIFSATTNDVNNTRAAPVSFESNPSSSQKVRKS